MDITRPGFGFGRVTLTVCGIVLVLLFLLLQAPAWALAGLISTATGGHVVLEQPEGNLWRGRANTVSVLLPAARSLRLARLGWTFAPSRILQGELGYTLVLEDAAIKGRTVASYGFSGWHLGQTDLTLPASALTPLVPLLELVAPGGTVHVSANDFSGDGARLKGEAQVEWRAASARMSAVSPLGDYRARINAEGSTAQYQVSTLAGPLRVEGKGDWSAAGARRFTGTARADPPQEAQLQDLLRMIGRDQGGGNYALNVN